MAQISASISIAGQPAPDLLPSVLELEVEEDHDMASIVRVKLAIFKPESGLWTFLDDDRIKPWNPISVSAAIADDEQEIFSGFITEIAGHFDIEDNKSFVVIHGMDATCLMALEEKVKDWPNMSDSDIATQIIGTYNLTPEVDDTGVVHDDTIATIIQRESDFHFLKRLARRNGYVCGVRGEQAYFRSRSSTAIRCRHSPSSSAATPRSPRWTRRSTCCVRCTRWRCTASTRSANRRRTRPFNRAIRRRSARTACSRRARPNGATPTGHRQTRRRPASPERRTCVRPRSIARSGSLKQRAMWTASRTAGFLRAQSLVPGERRRRGFSRMYYLTSVRHVLTVNGYMQHFTGRRNATAPNDSDFTSGLSLF